MSKNDLSVQKHKVTVKSKLKIYELNYNFKKKIKNTIGIKPFLVAVSGGPDSLALTALSKDYEKENNTKIYYVLIDHCLRKNSTSEAILVKKLLKKKKINLTILSNKTKIDKNIQSNARDARYKLLLNYCNRKKIKYILTGHHRDDQIETFLIRLSRGSGIQGLSSMNNLTKLKNNIKLFRPLLNEKKIDLTILAKFFFGKVFKDPSNQNQKYLRTKIRSLLKQFDKSGIEKDKIINSINNLASTRDTLNNYMSRIIKSCIVRKKNKVYIDYEKLFLEPVEIQLKIISGQIKAISSSYYPPRAKKVMNLIKKIKTKNVLKYTLGGCVILKSGKELVVSRETLKKSIKV
jgi:tRNA(Ile)-lysidine synthase